MNFDFLHYDVSDGIATITLNRPEVYNALNNKLTYELQDAFRETERDNNIRVIVLQSTGKGFCAGQDLKNVPKDKSFIESIQRRYNPLIILMHNLPKPIVCKIQGVAAGAGWSLALACDILIASKRCSFTQAFINIGLVPDSGSSYFLPRLVGRAKAFEICASGQKITGEEALRMGLINQLIDHDMLDNTVKKYAQQLANAPTKAIGLIKKMLSRSTHCSLEETLDYEAFNQEIAGQTQDHSEGVTAFLEKRKPVFKGQ